MIEPRNWLDLQLMKFKCTISAVKHWLWSQAALILHLNWSNLTKDWTFNWRSLSAQSVQWSEPRKWLDLQLMRFKFTISAVKHWLWTQAALTLHLNWNNLTKQDLIFALILNLNSSILRKPFKQRFIRQGRSVVRHHSVMTLHGT